MAQQTIGVGSTANDGTGDTLRAALVKCNDNFTELYGQAPAKGTSFPGSPTSGDRFYRTDLQKEFYYDGTDSLWLTTQEYEHNIILDEAVGTSHAASDTDTSLWWNTWKGRHNIRLKSWRYGVSMSGTGNWSVRLRENTGTILATATIAGSSYASNTAISATCSGEIIFGDLLENSGTATITSHYLGFTYRLIGT